MTDTPDSPPFDTDRLLKDCVAEALEHENPERFLQWFQARLDRYVTTPQPDLFQAPGDHQHMAAVMGRAIWNAMPLPGNGLRPRPLPEPGRNQRCYCGSGRKYKHCCAQASGPALASEGLLPLVLRQAPKGTLEQALRAGRAPVDSLIEVAALHVDEDKPKKAAQTLELLFDGKLRRHDERLEYAMDLLCDQYDALGYDRKKRALLETVVERAPRSPLRAGAWQRLATIRLDDGDPGAAWEAFQQARQDAPDAPSLGLLEVHLLYAERRVEEARERAAFWGRRLRRLGYEDDRLIGFLEDMADDPHAAMADVGMEAAGDAGRALSDWLDEAGRRPLPAYGVLDDSAPVAIEDYDDALRERLRAMGVPAGQMDEALAMLSEQLPGRNGEPSAAHEAAAPLEHEPEEPESLRLAPPAAVAAVEALWQEVVPVDKPFSVQADPFGEDDPWDPDEEAEWMAFLDAHPEAFDSLDILDDLAAMVRRHPQMGLNWVEDRLLEPLLRRAEAIVRQALDDQAAPHLSWMFPENRPALRSLSRLVEMHLRRGEEAEAERMAAWILELNPGDNHGYRALLANARLRRGDDTGVLALADRYPGDLNPEIAFGRVLALYRLGRLDEAQQALRQAVEHLPKIVRALTAKRFARPAVDPARITFGGDDQAWLYREEMRDVWADTPGALEWLKQASK